MHPMLPLLRHTVHRCYRFFPEHRSCRSELLHCQLLPDLHPRLLLLDEPLSALDAWSRASIGEQLRAIQEASGVTTVMVTHDRQEALSLSDYVVVMNAGHVEQADEPNDIYDRPASEFVATFVGGMNIVRMPLIREGAATGLRYADVKLYRATEAALTRPYTFVGQVQAVQFMGDAVRVKVLLNDFQTTITADALRINTDRSVFSLHSLIAVELPESAWRTWARNDFKPHVRRPDAQASPRRACGSFGCRTSLAVSRSLNLKYGKSLIASLIISTLFFSLTPPLIFLYAGFFVGITKISSNPNSSFAACPRIRCP
mgnify:CR=1 FL=1